MTGPASHGHDVRPILRYPTGWLLAVFDERSGAAEGARAVHAAGIPTANILILAGADGREAFRGLGASAGLLARIIRGVQFMSMDQMPDLPTYEAAIDEGKTVVAVRPSERSSRLAAKDALIQHGGHFLNYFGHFTTEEFSRWRGTEPHLPDYLRR